MSDINAEGYGVLSDSSFEKSRKRIGLVKHGGKGSLPFNTEVHPDSTRQFSWGYGDDNPLWWDEEYARNTRWGGIIAPPTFLYTMGKAVDTPVNTPEEKALLKGDPFAGLGSYQAVMSFEWFRPLQRGDGLVSLRSQVGVQDKRSEFGGRTAHVTNAMMFANERTGQMVAVQTGTWINAERHTSKARAKEVKLPEPYTPEQLAEIDAIYDAESRRGAEKRYFEDVNVGDSLDKKVKGPLVTTDVVVWHTGWGMQLTPPGTFSIARKVRKKAPGLYPPNSLNIPDTVQRLHWEPERAAELGIPKAYDYGAMRETWLVHLCTDWMGDDAWLWKMECQHRKFNYLGDTQFLTGEVVEKVESKTEDGVRCEVHVEIRCTNQRGEVTSPGKAIIILPSRQHGDVVLPKPAADDVWSMLDHQIQIYGGQR